MNDQPEPPPPEIPYDADSENHLLSMCMQCPQHLDAFSDDDSLFYVPGHDTIISAMRSIWGAEPLDISILTARLMDSGDLEKCGGPGFIAGLLDFAPTFAEPHFQWHLDRCRELRTRRAMVIAAWGIAASAADMGSEIAEVTAVAETRVLAVADTGADPEVSSVTLVSAQKSVISTWEQIQTGEVAPGIPTGLRWLDDLTCGGAKRGEFWVIAARPSVGKSAIGLNIILHMALSVRVPVGVFSLEMSHEQLAARALSDVGGIGLERMWKKAETVGEREEVEDAISKIKEGAEKIRAGASVLIDGRATLTPASIRSTGRRWVRREGVRAIFVDYLQRIAPGSERARKDERLQIAEASNALAALAKELKVPVIALAQINREGGKRGAPASHDLKGSGDIEQDADLIALMWTMDGGAPHGQRFVGFKVSKHRTGPLGDTTLRFRPDITHFDAESVPEDEVANEGGNKDLPL